MADNQRTRDNIGAGSNRRRADYVDVTSTAPPLDDEDDVRVSWREPTEASPEARRRKKVGFALAGITVAVVLSFVITSRDDSSNTEVDLAAEQAPASASIEEQISDVPEESTETLPAEASADSAEEAASTPTTEAPVTTSPPPPPGPATTGDDFNAITREIFRYKTALEHQPDESKAADIYAADSPALHHFAGDLAAMSAAKTASQRPEPEVIDVEVADATGQQRVTVEARTRYGGGPTLIETLVLVNDTDAHWRIADHRVRDAE